MSGLLHEFKLGVIFLLVFAPLRVFTGGYHAVTYFRCFLISNISYLFLLLFNNIIYTKLPLEIWLILLVLSSYYIAIHAPVVNENQPIGENKKSRCKIMARNILNINVFAALFLSAVDKEIMGMMVLSICLVAVFMLITDKPKFLLYTKKGVIGL